MDTFIDAPRALFGRTRAGVEHVLGVAASIRARTLTGGWAASDPVDELAYPGVVDRRVARRRAALMRSRDALAPGGGPLR